MYICLYIFVYIFLLTLRASLHYLRKLQFGFNFSTYLQKIAIYTAALLLLFFLSSALFFFFFASCRRFATNSAASVCSDCTGSAASKGSD